MSSGFGVRILLHSPDCQHKTTLIPEEVLVSCSPAAYYLVFNYIVYSRSKQSIVSSKAHFSRQVSFDHEIFLYTLDILTLFIFFYLIWWPGRYLRCDSISEGLPNYQKVLKDTAYHPSYDYSQSVLQMPTGVKEALRQSVQRYIGRTEEEAKEYVQNLERAGRLIEEC
ncbi:hypothetical protein K435DRAFT_849593 [Dendrothele bispora CBS 962.96]|uniref:Uncharacterized protein n=1 Tax=Dendrothele bispora (strain CBS 962.96) TaxID=1314807 RepID=A0A4S8MRW1_DENBC|nr:hypothetical protein K435DRAFT_849593 [Dendrothele bispora CBS 962.96]